MRGSEVAIVPLNFGKAEGREGPLLSSCDQSWERQPDCPREGRLNPGRNPLCGWTLPANFRGRYSDGQAALCGARHRTKMIGEPDAGNPHVRFDEGVQETCDRVTRLCPTLPQLCDSSARRLHKLQANLAHTTRFLCRRHHRSTSTGGLQRRPSPSSLEHLPWVLQVLCEHCKHCSVCSERS
jgi:hypothetical protein